MVRAVLCFPGATAKLTTAVERIRRTDRNVIGILPPADFGGGNASGISPGRRSL